MRTEAKLTVSACPPVAGCAGISTCRSKDTSQCGQCTFGYYLDESDLADKCTGIFSSKFDPDVQLALLYQDVRIQVTAQTEPTANAKVV